MQQRRGTAAQWVSTNSGNGPILNAGEIGFETDTNKFKIGDGTNHWINLDYFVDANSTANPSFGSSITFEGSTSDAYETLVSVIDPTADRSIILPDASGTVVLADGSGNVTVSGDLTVSGTTTIIDSTTINVQNQLIFEGATSNAYETTLTVVDPTADRTITLPNATGTVVLAEATQTLDNKSINLNANTLTGTIALFNTALSDADFATLAGTETLTNKTLTSPKINEDVAVTATATEINVLDGITASTAELNKLDGVTATTAELNILASATLSTAELNILDGATLSTAELNYVDGVTSAIQSQLDGKQAIISGVSDTELGYLDGVTSSIQTQLNGKQATVAGVSDVEIGYLDGVTSAIQTQIDAKAPLASPTFTGTVTLPSGTVTSTMISDGTIVNADINASAAIDWSKLAISSTVSSTELGYVDGVTSAIQTQLDAKAPLAGPTFTGTMNAAELILSGNLTVNGTTTTVSTANFTTEDALIYIGEGNSANLVDLGFVASFNDGTYQHSGLVKDSSDSKWKLFKGVTDEPTTTINFTQGSLDALAVGALEATTVTPSSGIVFSDGTQTKQGVPSITPIIQKTASYTLSSLTERDSLIEVASASGTTITIPTNSAVAYPVGTSIDILQTSTGQVTIAGDTGVTVNATPGLKLRAQWSSCTLFKRATNTWIVMGDLSA